MSPFPRFELPGDAFEWMRASDVEACAPVFKDASKDGPPSVTLVRKASPDVLVARAWAQQMRDGSHFFFTASPGSSATVQLAFRKAPIREMKMSATAGLAAIFALRFHKRSEKAGNATDDPSSERDWLKKAHKQILGALRQHGAEALVGMGPVFLSFTRESVRLIDRALGRDLEESLSRVRKEFAFLVDHLDEEGVLRLWRETVVTEVHDL